MSQQLIDHSPDLRKLIEKGFNLEIRSAHLLVRDVPYVNSRKEIKLGILVMALNCAGDVTAKPSTHVAHFSGEYPCNADGSEIAQIRNSSNRQILFDDYVVDHTFSAKPTPDYPDFYVKVSTYVTIITCQAQILDPTVTAHPHRTPDLVIEDNSPFQYPDTASARAGTTTITQLLAKERVAIVGLGGTGSYVLDLVAKTPVKEIHLFDGDQFQNHNAFRAPGAPSLDELSKVYPKVEYFKTLYSKMHRGIIAHNLYVDANTFDELHKMTFVFLCTDSGSSRRVIVSCLSQLGIPFCDVGMGVIMTDGRLGGILRITTATGSKSDHLASRINYGDSAEDEYASNIQIADLNALNAALGVIKWKKLRGFYRDLKQEHNTFYTIDTNHLQNEDRVV